MNLHTDARKVRGVAGALIALSAAAALLSWSLFFSQQTQAANELAKTEMHLEIDGISGGSAVECDSRTQTTCKLDRGRLFSLQVVPDTIPVGGYVLWQTLLDYGSMQYRPTAFGTDEMKWDLSAVPLRSPLSPIGDEGQVFHTDASGASPPRPASTQKTAIVNLDFFCTPSDATPAEGFSQLIRLIDFNEDVSGAVFVHANEITLSVPNVTDFTVQCNMPSKQTDPGDTDEDGCTDQAENGPSGNIGGLRDYFYFWDFYDVWTPPLDGAPGWEHDKVVTILDIIEVAARFGPGPPMSNAEAYAQALIPPTDESSYHPSFDRGPIIGSNAWDRAPPDATINVIDDILGVAAQFGHSCL